MRESIQKYLWSIGLLLCTFSMSAQNVTNVRVRQDGNDIIISYDLAKKSNIRVFVSKGPYYLYTELKAVTGSVGKNISKGKNHWIVWSPLDEYDEFVVQGARFKVETYDDVPVSHYSKNNYSFKKKSNYFTAVTTDFSHIFFDPIVLCRTF